MHHSQTRKIIMAEKAGFCFGVQRAVDKVYAETEKGGQVYTFGPIIHNETVISDLAERGVRIIHSADEAEALHGATVVLRSHGVTREVFRKLSENKEIRLIDATCPFVRRIHEIVEERSRAGDYIVIIGNVGHAEVEGTLGWSEGPASVIETAEEARAFRLPDGMPLTVVAQTTFNARKFEEFIAILKEKGYNGFIVNTICSATSERQAEARRISRQVDAMIVIGSSTSSNSAKLFEICRRECDRTFFIQSYEDLGPGDLAGAGTIGITAGASTPRNIIEEVMEHVGNGTNF